MRPELESEPLCVGCDRGDDARAAPASQLRSEMPDPADRPDHQHTLARLVANWAIT